MKLNLIDTKLDDTVYEFIDDNFHMEIFNQNLPNKHYVNISTDAWSIIIFMFLCNQEFYHMSEIVIGGSRQLASTLDSLLSIKLLLMEDEKKLTDFNKIIIQNNLDNNNKKTTFKKRLLSLWRSLYESIRKLL